MRTRLVPLLAVVAVVGQAGCAGSPPLPEGAATNPLAGAVTSSLGVSPRQAAAGLGAMLSLAQSRLPPDQSTVVTTAIPGAGDLLKAAAQVTGGAPVGSLAAVQNVFSKLGMSPDMVSKFAPFLTNAVGSVGGPELAGMLGALFQ